MKRNVGSQLVSAQMIKASDGSNQTTGTCNVAVEKDGVAGTGGTATHVANGKWEYAPIQADTDGAQLTFQFVITGAITAQVQVYTGFPQTVDNATGIADVPTVAEFNARTLVAADYFDPAADTVATVTTLTNKTGFSLSTAGILAIWNQATSALTTAGRIGKLLVDNINATITSAATATGFATPANVATALTDIHLDHLLAVDYDPVAKPGAATALFNELIENDAGVPRYTVNALENGPSGSGASAAAIADAVWDEALTGGSHNVPTSAGRRLRGIQEFQGYESGAIWIDTVNGTAGTTDFENGTVENPVLTLADAVTIATSLNIYRFHVASGSTITLASTHSNQVFEGTNWTLALGGQNIDGCQIHGAKVSGIATNTSGTQMFMHCVMGAVTLPSETHVHTSGLSGTQTLGEAGNFFYDQCHSAVAGAGSVTLDFGAALNSSNVNVRHHSGGWTVANMGAGTGTYEASFEGNGQIVWAASCSATSNASIRGNWKITDSAGGAVTETLDDNQTDVDAILAAIATTGVVLSATQMNKIADHVIRRNSATARASSDGDTVDKRSLLGVASKLTNKVAVVGTDLVAYEEDDSTAFLTQALTTDAAADPITALDTA